MKINIEIELENGDYCNGCPMLDVRYYYCKQFKLNLGLGAEKIGSTEGYDVNRAEICKEQNKEKTK